MCGQPAELLNVAAVIRTNGEYCALKGLHNADFSD
jgi:hypothetical protein